MREMVEFFKIIDETNADSIHVSFFLVRRNSSVDRREEGPSVKASFA